MSSRTQQSEDAGPIAYQIKLAFKVGRSRLKAGMTGVIYVAPTQTLMTARFTRDGVTSYNIV